jgi:hypothetical protein
VLKEQGLASRGDMMHHHEAQIAFQLRMVDYLMVEGHLCLVCPDTCKARQIAVCDFPIVNLGASRTTGTWPLGQVSQMSITTEFADQVHRQPVLSRPCAWGWL